MNIFKSKIGLKLTVFATILLVLFWMIPSGMVFGEGEEGGTPVITLLGDAEVNINVGDAYSDAGATALDDVDGDISANILVGGTVDTATAASYILTYDVSDSDGNAAPTVSRTVNVAAVESPGGGNQGETTPAETTSQTSENPDTTPPVITLNGDAVIDLHIGNTFTDPGATAADDVDENVAVTATGAVNTNLSGSYTISYDAIDAAGNAAASVTRTVNVISTATIFTDKPDYLPDDYVLVTGSGWLPGETVKLDFHETLIDPLMQQTTTYYTVADSNGHINDIQYLIEIRHLGASFILTATGQTSGLTAQTTFTDAWRNLIIHKFGETVMQNSVQDTGEPNIPSVQFYIEVRGPLGNWSPVVIYSPYNGYFLTDSNGRITKNLPDGHYRISETSTPSTYKPISGVYWEGDLNASTPIIEVPNVLSTPTTVTITKEVLKSDGAHDADDLTPFTMDLWKDVPSGTDIKVNQTGPITLISDHSITIDVLLGYSYYVTETSNSFYTTTYSPVGAITAANGNNNITVENKQTAPCTVTITKEVLKSDGTPDADDLTLFTMDLWKDVPSGTDIKVNQTGPITLKNGESETIAVSPGNSYYVSETPDSYYTTTYLPVGVITAANGNNIITVRNTQITPNTVTITKEVYRPGGAIRDTSDLTSFNMELWKVGVSGNPDTLVATGPITLSDGKTSPAIPVSPGSTYYVVENPANPNYTTTYPLGQITIANGSSNNFIVQNTQNVASTVTVTKEVYKPDGTTRDTDDLTTFNVELWKVGGTSPIITFPLRDGQTSPAYAVSPGSSYYVVENPTNPNYTTTYPSGQITIAHGSSNSFTVKNTQNVASTVTIKKEVYRSGGTTPDTSDLTAFTIELWKVGAPNTLVTTVNLQSGQTSAAIAVSPGNSYYVVENPANPNYTTTYPSGTITVANGSSNTFTVRNTNKAATITVYKNVFQPDGTTPDPTDLTTFEVTLKKSVNFGNEVIVATKTVSQSSPAVFDTEMPTNGALNLYWVEETANPKYAKSGDGILNAQYINQGESKSFTIGNTQNGNTFTVTKTGLEYNNGLDFFSDRAKFTLYRPDGLGGYTIVRTSTGADSITLDCNDLTPSMLFPDTYTWDRLPNGTGYKLVESYDVSLGNRYIYSSSLAGNQYFFNINGSNESVTVNNYVNGGISAYKTDKALLPLAGAQIGLFANINDASPIMPAVISSDVSGAPNVGFSNVPTGGIAGITYYIHEISAPAGFAADPGWYEIKISDSDRTPTLSTRIINKADGTITLYKKDNNGNALAGAVFGLYTAQDVTLTPITATSDINGEVKFTELTCSLTGLTYHIREISPPAGFVPDENWYSATLTTGSPKYTFTQPIINTPGGTITVTKNVIAPDGKTDVSDAKEFTITLEKNNGGNWTPVKTAKIKEGSPVVFYVPLNITYRVVETADAKYTETDKACEVKLTTQGQNVDIGLINKQHYAVIIMGKIIYQWDFDPMDPSTWGNLMPNLITDDDHIFFTKLEGGHPSLIEWHPIATKIPTAFLVWPGTYTVYEKPDVNYNNNGQPVILSGFDLSNFNLADIGDIGNLVNILFGALIGGSNNTSPVITVEGGDIKPLIIANKYIPQFGTVTVTKDVVDPVGQPTTDNKLFSVKLQRLNLTLPNILDFLNLENVGNIANLSDLMGILDLTQLDSLSNLLGWEDVGTPKNVSEGNPVTFTGAEKDHIYRVVETQAPGYMQIYGILPFYFEPEATNKQIDIVNKQELVWVKVSKDVIGADGLPVKDCTPFGVKLDGGPTSTGWQMIYEKTDPKSILGDALFAVMPGTYTLTECPQNCYDRVDTIGTVTFKQGDGPFCDPIELTVINKQKPGTISITKTGLMPGDSAIFTLCDKDGKPIAGKAPITLSEGQSGSWTGLNWGCYTISESYPAANLYTYGTAEFCPSGPISIGCMGCMDCLSKRVVIKNKDPHIKEAEIVVIKYVYGTLLAGENFSFTNSQGPGFTLDGTESPTAWQKVITVQAGKTYTIAENDPGADWMTTWDSTLPNTITTFGTARDITFTVTGDNIASIDGKNISFYNNRKTCEVIIDKTIGGAPAAEGTFNFSGPARSVSSRILSTSNFLLPDSGSYQKSFTLECGIEYTVTEDSMSAGYVFNNIAASPAVEVTGQTGSSITFKLHCNNIAQNRVTNITGGTVGVINTITFDNSRVPGTINLHKTDAISGANLAGAVFRLFLPDGTTQAMDFEGDDLVPDVTTDAAGLGSFANLAWGSYIVREINPPVGYEPKEADVTIDGSNLVINLESEIADPRIPGKLRLQKVSSTNALQAVANATYEVRDSGGNLVALITTAADGWAVVSLPWGTYSVKEVTAPAGYDLDPTTYSVTIGASLLEPWLYLKDNPSKGGGGGTVTVAGLTEGIQVLAFTGIDPIIPISGGSAVIAGLAMLLATLKRRVARK